MIFSRLFWYSWLFFYKKQKDIITVSNELEIEKKICISSQNITNGCDTRYKEEDQTMITKIIKNKERYTQLQILQNPHISVIEKLMIIEAIEKEENSSIRIFDFQRGGFWKDWE